MVLLRLVFCVLAFLFLPKLVEGQDLQNTSGVELTVEQTSELQKWMKDDTKWKKWYKRWGNRTGVRLRHRPDPPVWLAPECEGLFGGEGVLVRACGLLSEINEDPGTRRIRESVLAQTQQKEAPTKTSFLERVHFGGGWPLVMQLGMFKYGAIFESHVSIASVGRVELNLPGVALLTVPNEKGKRTVKFGTDIGVSVRLRDFQMPGTRQLYTLHLNLANAWVSESIGGGLIGYQNRLSLAGFSLTVKK